MVGVFYVCKAFDPDFVTSIMLLEFLIEIVLSVLIHSTSIPYSLASHKKQIIIKRGCPHIM